MLRTLTLAENFKMELDLMARDIVTNETYPKLLFAVSERIGLLRELLDAPRPRSQRQKDTFAETIARYEVLAEALRSANRELQKYIEEREKIANKMKK